MAIMVQETELVKYKCPKCWHVEYHYGEDEDIDCIVCLSTNYILKEVIETIEKEFEEPVENKEDLLDKIGSFFHKIFEKIM